MLIVLLTILINRITGKQTYKNRIAMKLTKPSTPQTEIATVITKGTKMNGTVHSDDSLRIDGHVIGDINVRNKLITGPDSLVQGQVYADEIIIGGKVDGDLYGRNMITIRDTGHVSGQINTSQLVVDQGGILDGTSNMTQVNELEPDNVIEMGLELFEKQA